MDIVNLELVRQKVQEIRESQSALRDYAAVGREEFISNRQVSDAAKYRLLIAIEACIAICNHLASRVAKKAPSTFAECFEILHEQKIIHADLCEQLKLMTRFRNLVIHGYWKIEDHRVYDIAETRLGDFDEYARCLESWLEKQI